MNILKKINTIVLLILISSPGFAQNHRQLSNWFCGDYIINKIVDGTNTLIASTHIVNLSPIDSSNYWLVEDLSVNKIKKQRLLHLNLLDSGCMGVVIYDLKKDKLVQAITSFSQINFNNYNLINQSTLVMFYNRPSKGFEILKSENRFFYLDKFNLRVECCNDFSAFYFDALKKESELILIKRVD
jgi:hypothetical protein